MSKISALVSAYYSTIYLEARIINLREQSAHPEIIIVAQKGSDEEAIAGTMDLNPITTDDIPNIGVAWNLGIQHAQGDYLTTANTDDIFKKDGLRFMAETLDNHPEIDLVFSRVDIMAKGKISEWRRLDRPTGEIKDMRKVLERQCMVGPMPMWRKSIHDRIGLFDEEFIVACDYDMWLRMVRAGMRFYYIDEALGYYYRRPYSLEYRNKLIIPFENARARA